MEELTLEARFDQLLSFLKDPKAHSHPFVTLEDFKLHLGENPRAEVVHEFLQIAIDILESGLIRQGYLKGNRRTPDIPIHRLENFILNAAVNVQLAKWVIAKSPTAYEFFDAHGLFDDAPRVRREDIIEEWNNLDRAFHRLAWKILRYANIRIDRIRTISKILLQLQNDSYSKARDQAMVFDLVNELILTFLENISEAPDNLIASHIFNFINMRRDSTLKGVHLPVQSAIRKRVENLRKKLIITPTI